MADTLLHIDGTNFPVAADSLLPKGKRAYVRIQRDSQPTDPGKLVIKQWKLSGPLGQSRQSGSFLGIDWATLEHRYDDLLTSLPAVSTLTVSGSDSPSAGSSAALGALVLGGSVLGGGSSLSTPLTISHIREWNDRLWLARGAITTQVNPSSWVVEATRYHSAVVKGMGIWFNKLRLGMGGALAMQTVTGVTTTGATYSNTQVSGSDVLAKELMEGNDRFWMVRGDPAGTNENRLRYTLDDFSSISNQFVVGDPGVAPTGLGRLGPYTVMGTERGAFSFTDEGSPVSLLEELRDCPHDDNGRKMAYQFGWLYLSTEMGLYAIRPGVTNPVGIGSKSMWGFEGFDGHPTAVYTYRESLIAVYENSASDTWRILEGTFGPATDGTGELEWFMLAQRTNAEVKCLGATIVPTLHHIVWGEGANTLARIAKGRGGKDILDASYTYSVGGGQWFGTALMERPHLRKTIRWGRFTTESLVSGDSWTLAVSFDGGSYTNIGSAVTANGSNKVVPATLTSAPSGYLPKPRLTQVAGGSGSDASPPQLRGYLEIAYDERPEKVDEVTVMLAPLSRPQQALLRAHADPANTAGRQPVELRLPGDPVLHYGYVLEVKEADVAGDAVVGLTASLLLVETS